MRISNFFGILLLAILLLSGCAGGDNQQNNTRNSTITKEQAMQIALKRVPGATLQDIRHFETDYDFGVLQYEGKIVYRDSEYEFEINGISGIITEWDAEPLREEIF